MRFWVCERCVEGFARLGTCLGVRDPFSPLAIRFASPQGREAQIPEELPWHLFRHMSLRSANEYAQHIGCHRLHHTPMPYMHESHRCFDHCLQVLDLLVQVLDSFVQSQLILELESFIRILHFLVQDLHMLLQR